ncbi:hypothetical protein [Pseudoalteromonas sp. SK18]|uniref:hypothetical protein n=1 Tax=Pseudoalteromonas sp. SK18 TaxID=1938366 RepID=UPI0009773F9D|nr:hypothetical protein [Pseudoalteromonas sp. SK18]
MHTETELLVSAIESLKQEPNFFKDYIFPIASAFFTSILGGLIAYFALNKQESLQIEKEKLSAANKWTLDIERARASLISIKGNYHKQLTAVPIQRLFAIPSIIIKSEPILESYQDLAFIVPSEDTKETEFPKWSQITRINAAVANYNSLLHMWEKRNELNEQFKQSVLIKHGNNAFANLSLADAESAFGKSGLAILIDLNEKCIKLTDHIIIELNDFLENFPTFAKTKINLKRLKKVGRLITYSNNANQVLLELIKSEQNVDFTSVQNLFGESTKNLDARNTTGYE